MFLNNSKLMIATVLGVLQTSSILAFGTTLLVPEDFPTIQDALNVAVLGDQVSVAPGVYNENVIFQSNGVTLLSRTLHASTIDGGGSGHVVVLNTFSGTVDGFVITGGGFSNAGVFTSQASQVIQNNIITGNNGRGIWISGGSVAWIENNVITNNSSSGYGIGFFESSGTVVNNYIAQHSRGISCSSVGSVVIVNNTIVDSGNYSIFINDASAEITNNILANANYGIFFVGPFGADITSKVSEFLTISHNDVWGNSQLNYYAELGGIPNAIAGSFSPMPGIGEISVDPLLNGALGYSLQPGSPCIDAGDNNAVPLSVSTDLAGNPRFFEDLATIDTGNGTAPIVDIGALEFGGGAAGIPTVSVWGMTVLSLLCLSAGTFVFRKIRHIGPPGRHLPISR